MTFKTDEITREYFNSMLIIPRYLDSDLPDINIELFNRTYKTPVMTAALSHLHNICENAMFEFAKGAHEAGAAGVAERIDTINRELITVMARTGAKTIADIDPSVIRYRAL